MTWRDVASRAVASRVFTEVERETELALVRRLKQGDGASFDLVYDGFRPRLFGFLVRLSRRRDVAEDLLAETWLRLVSRSRTLADDTRLGPWLFTVARNLYYSYCRSRMCDDERVSELTCLWPAPERLESQFDAVATGELEQRIERGLASLPLREREALLLVAVEGLAPCEAAAVCGVTPDALRQRLSRARAALRRKLGGDAGTHEEGERR